MPARLIDEDHGVCTRSDLFADDREMGVHRVGVAVRHHQPGGLAFGGTDGAEYVGPFRALIMRRAGPGPTFGPASCQLVLLANPGLVLPPQFDFRTFVEASPDLCQPGREAFLKTSASSVF